MKNGVPDKDAILVNNFLTAVSSVLKPSFTERRAERPWDQR